MSEVRKKTMKRIFYFNITYGCNSNCIFCYSHNTWHNSVPHNEMTIEAFLEYLEENSVDEKDRVIINGGEPLLHTRIMELLVSIKKYGCEVLIYTNGRLLDEIDLSILNSKYRFVIPVHGYQDLHDSITGVKGSYAETINGMNHFKSDISCKLDLKVILNNGMIKSNDAFQKTLSSFNQAYFNNAVHLTSMADTIISVKNNCESINNEIASTYMELLFNYFMHRGCRIKVFDTCIKSFTWLHDYEILKMQDNLEVYFKDCNQGRKLVLEKPDIDCMISCNNREYCMSAVGEYTVLEFYDNKLLESLE